MYHLMKKHHLLFALFSLWSVTVSTAAPTADHIYDITKFGAKPDGQTLNTIAIQSAIDQCTKDGGGQVLVPPGQFLTGSIHLGNHVHLYLQLGASLMGSGHLSDYSDNGSDPKVGQHLTGAPEWLALIFARSATDVSISGPGFIDGDGKALAKDVADVYKVKGGRAPEEKRPQLLCFSACKGLEIQDVTLKNSACWVETYDKCDGLTLQGVTVDSTAFWNNDGIDVVDCKNVLINKCNINSADDGICLKSHDAHDSCENITISDCKVRSSASAFKIGTASLGGFHHIKVSNLYVYDTFRSAIAIECVDGGTISDVVVDGVTAKNTGAALFIVLHDRRGEPKETKDITIKNMTVSVPKTKPDAGYDTAGPERGKGHIIFPSSITGLPGHDVENVTLENIQITTAGGCQTPASGASRVVPENEKRYPEFSMYGELPSWGLYMRHVKNISLKNVQLKALEPDNRPACVFDDVNGATTNDINFTPTVLGP